MILNEDASKALIRYIHSVYEFMYRVLITYHDDGLRFHGIDPHHSCMPSIHISNKNIVMQEEPPVGQRIHAVIDTIKGIRAKNICIVFGEEPAYGTLKDDNYTWTPLEPLEDVTVNTSDPSGASFTLHPKSMLKMAIELSVYAVTSQWYIYRNTVRVVGSSGQNAISYDYTTKHTKKATGSVNNRYLKMNTILEHLGAITTTVGVGVMWFTAERKGVQATIAIMASELQ